jgi:hypothetical protein
MVSGWAVGWVFGPVVGAASDIDAARFLEAGPPLAAV